MSSVLTASDATRSTTPIQSRALLAQCRDVARGRLRRTAADAFQRMEAELFAVAEGSQSREQQNILFELIAKIRENRDEMARTFEKMVGQVFDERLLARDPNRKDKPRTETLAEHLKLVDDGHIMNTMVLSELVKRAKLTIDHKHMNGVRLRVAHLMGLETLEDRENPLGVEAVVEALDLTCSEYATDSDARHALLNVFQKYLAEGMTEVYAEVNAMLVARNILPRLKTTIVRSASGPGMAALEAALSKTGSMSALSMSQPMRQFSASQPFGQGAGALEALGLPMSVTQPIRIPGLTTSSTPGVNSLTGGTRTGFGLSPEATAALAQIAAGPADARRQIVRMLAEPSRHSFDAAIATPATPELVNLLNGLQNQLSITSGLTQSWLRSLDQEVRSNSHPLDQLTIDFVAALFDIIFHDKSITDALKAEIARMQIVAIKAAIIDRSFFARRQHPMRHFLDRIAECANDPNLDTSMDSPFVAGVREIVDELNTNFVEDLSLISAAVEKLEALIATHSAGEEEKSKIDTVAIEEAERREIAVRMADAEFARRLPASAPEFLQRFLKEWWLRALIESFVGGRQGEDSWARRLEIMDELVWSVGPLRSPSVPRLASILPKMMQDVSRGMTAAEVPADARKVFFEQLMGVHTGVIKEAKSAPRVLAGQAAAEPAALEQPKQLAPLEPDSVDLSGNADDPNSFHEHFVNALEKGALVEFNAVDPAGNQIWQRLKLAWVSPKRMVFLFTARLTKARQLPRAALVEALQTGTARLVDGSERYLDQAIEAIAVTAG